MGLHEAGTMFVVLVPKVSWGHFVPHARSHGGEIPIFGAPNREIPVRIPINGCKLTFMVWKVTSERSFIFFASEILWTKDKASVDTVVKILLRSVRNPEKKNIRQSEEGSAWPWSGIPRKSSAFRRTLLYRRMLVLIPTLFNRAEDYGWSSTYITDAGVVSWSTMGAGTVTTVTGVRVKVVGGGMMDGPA